jgi:O-antigen/teichoic acid export membrane protein
LFSAIASLLSVILFSRLLSADAYGQYATILAMVAVFETAGFGWLQSSIIRLYPGETDLAGRDGFATALLAGFAASAFIISAAWAASLSAAGSAVGGGLLPIGRLAILLFRSWATMGQNWSRVTGTPGRFLAAQALQSIGSLFFALLILLWWGGSAIVPLVASAIASLLASAVVHVPISSRVRGFQRLESRLRTMWAYGAPIAAISFGFTLLAASDRFLLATIVGTGAAGAYSAASSLAERSIGLLVLPIALAARPQIFVEFSKGGGPPARHLMRLYSGWLLAVGLPVTTLLVVAPSAITSVFVGSELAGAAAKVLPWTAVSALLSSLLTLHFGLAFEMAHRTKSMLRAVGPAVVLNVASNILLLPIYGTVAAGWSTVLGYAIALLLTVQFGRRHFRVPFSGDGAIRTAAACVPLAAFINLDFQRTIWGLAFMIIGGAATYVASAFVLNVVGCRTYLRNRLLSALPNK